MNQNNVPARTKKFVIWSTIIGLALALVGAPAAQATPSNGYLDPSFNSNGSGGFNSGFAPYRPSAMALQSDGKLIVVGAFTTYNGSPASGIARLNTDGTLDTSFAIGNGFSTPDTKMPEIVQIASDGTVYVAGKMDSYDGQTVSRIVKLSTSGTLDTTFSTNIGVVDGVVYSIALLGSGQLIFGGSFKHVGSTQVAVGGIARVNNSGTIDSNFNTKIGTGFVDSVQDVGNVLALAVQSNGDVVAGGIFNRLNGATIAQGIARIKADGTVSDATTTAAFNTNAGAGFGGSVLRLRQDSTGKLIASGSFTTYNGQSARSIIRLNSDGTRDLTFVMGTGVSAQPGDITVAADDKVIVSGTGLTYNGTSVPSGTFRLNTDGTLDSSLVVAMSSPNSACAVLTAPSGDIYLAGPFTTYSSATVGRVVRLANAPVISPSTQNVSSTVGQNISTASMATTGLSGSVTFSVSPSLPSGLSLNASTGVISGSSSSPLSATAYTVTASNGSASATASVNITIAAQGSGGSGASELANTGAKSQLPIALIGLMFLFVGISVYSGSVALKRRPTN